jgi:hypothetical protein
MAFECPICCESLPSLLPWSPACASPHSACSACCAAHLLSELSSPAPRLACWSPGCAALLGAGCLESLLEGEGSAFSPVAAARARGARTARAREGAAAAAAAVLAAPLFAQPCARASCEEPFVGDRGAAPTLARCGACDIGVCAACGVEWAADGAPQLGHRGRACADVAAARTAVAAAAEEERAAQEAAASGGGGSSDPSAEALRALGVKRCPQCGTGVAHYRGHACHHIAPGGGDGYGCPECRQRKLDPRRSHFCLRGARAAAHTAP